MNDDARWRDVGGLLLASRPDIFLALLLVGESLCAQKNSDEQDTIPPPSETPAAIE